jgi:hypothetical protein
VPKNRPIDGRVREKVRAQRRVIKRMLRKHDDLPEKQAPATHIALEPAEVLSRGWT